MSPRAAAERQTETAETLRTASADRQTTQAPRADVVRQTEETRASRAAVDRQAEETYAHRAAVNRQTEKARAPVLLLNARLR